MRSAEEWCQDWTDARGSQWGGTYWIRRAQIDALKWALDFEYDTMTELRDKIKELEAAK